MPDNTIHTQQEVEDLVRGLTLLGTGGGGAPELGREFLLRHIQAGQSVAWTDLASIPDDAWTCTVLSMGSIAPQEPLSEAECKRLGYAGVQVEYPMVSAVQELALHVGQEIQAIVPFEPGGRNTPAPLDAATRLGISLVDADYAGRAIPELAQTIAAVEGYPFWPAAICDPWGNTLIMKSAPSTLVAERVGKMISIATRLPDNRAICAHAGFLLKAGEMKQLVVPGTLTLSLKVGAAIREAREADQDPLKVVTDALEGWQLFAGTVTRKDWESRDGYMFGTTVIAGTGAFEGDALEIWFKNEHHITWRDGAPYVTSPDLIMVVDQATGEPITNTVLSEGQKVAVLGAKADSRYRTDRGLAALGPAHFDFEMPYRPIEALVT